MGVSVVTVKSGGVLAADLVARPALNRNGMLGYPPATVRTVGRPALGPIPFLDGLLVEAWLEGPTLEARDDA